MIRLEHLCVQYLEGCIGHRNVLVALQNAARLKLDYIKVGAPGRLSRIQVKMWIQVQT